MRIPAFIKKFLPYKMKRQVKELFISAVIVNFALAMVQIFEPIYLYKSGYSLLNIAVFYLIVYALYFFLMPLGAKFANKHGYENGMFIGTALYVLFYVLLFMITKYHFLFYVAAVVYTIQKIFYWPAFHANFAHNSEDTEEAKEISSIFVSNSLMFVLGPIIGGFIITYFGFPILFIIVSILFLSSNIPMLLTKEKFDKREFPYFILVKKLFKKNNIRSLIACIGYGEELIAMVVWPVFIFIMIASYSKIGALIGLATLITSIITLYVGKICDQKNKRKVLRLGATFYSLSWLIKLFTRTILPIFLVDTMAKVSKNVVDVPIRAIFYEKAKDEKKFNDNGIMENIVNYEAGLVVGKVIACLVIIISLSIFSVQEFTGFAISFVFAAIATLLYMFL